MGRVNYTEFEGGFNQIVLEESFVLNLKTTMSFVDFTVSFAVNPNYPLYVPPEPPPPPSSGADDADSDEARASDYWDDEEEQEAGEEDASPENASSGDKDEEPAVLYPYRRGRIFFPNMEQVRWVSRIQPYIDPASGGVDYGAIDYFYRDDEDGRYYLAGYWGELDLVSGPPILEIDELKQHNIRPPAASS
jgi:hypothetical protein